MMPTLKDSLRVRITRPIDFPARFVKHRRK
jgi:hypothetical protein